MNQDYHLVYDVARLPPTFGKTRGRLRGAAGSYIEWAEDDGAATKEARAARGDRGGSCNVGQHAGAEAPMAGVEAPTEEEA
eukprot:SAG11_NODE_10110_length_854_cov_1.602649_1_plen_81_part_00